MASWIVHLRIAEKLLQAIPGLHPASFAVGNIAPDSGIPDEKWENFTPPPEVTHFAARKGGPFHQADLEFYRQYLAGCSPSGDPARFSFLLGYFAHLVTDNLWSVKIGLPTKARFEAEFAANKDFIWEVKRDWYGLDFIYLRDHPASPIWALFKTCRYTQDYLPFLPPEAVAQRLEYICQYYETIDDEVRAAYLRPYIYLSQAEMDRFVDAAVDAIAAGWRLITEQGLPGEPYVSVLEVLPSM